MKQRLYWQSINASAWTLRKLETFYALSLWSFYCLTKALSFLMYMRTNVKSFSYITCDKIENTQWNCVTNRSATHCNLYELCFSLCNYNFDNKVDIIATWRAKKTLDWSFSTELAKRTHSVDIEKMLYKSQNILMQQYLYGIT